MPRFVVEVDLPSFVCRLRIQFPGPFWSFIAATVFIAGFQPPTSSSSSWPAGAVASASASAPAQSANPNAITISNIEQLAGWSSCDTCAGGGRVPYSMLQALTHPLPGSTKFSIGRGAPWSRALWWKRLGNNPNISHFVLSVDQYMEDPAASWGIEYNVNQLLNGEWFKFSTQCSFGEGVWKVWDSAGKRWTRTSVPCSRPALKRHLQLRMEFERAAGKAHFVSISINGRLYAVGRAFDPQPVKGKSGDFGVHFQLNANKECDPYSVWVHNFELTYW
jgi:hypothetical protein